MKKIFLIPLLTLFSCVMAWAGNQPAKAIEPVPFQFNEAAPAAKAAAPARMKAEVAEQDILLEYEGFSQHFSDIQAAFNALPANSTPATITLLTDQEIVYTGGHAVTLNQFHRVTLDLNGHTMYCETPVDNKSTSVIYNKGTLTIKDGQGGGKLINLATNVDQWQAAGKPFPYYYNNVITNSGTLNIESGTIQNISYTGACYAVDNQSTSNHAILNVSGTAVLESTQDYAVRQLCNSATYRNEVNISGGIVEGHRAVWMQLPGSDKTKTKLGSFTMSGGTITSNVIGGEAFYKYSYGDKSDNVNITITGGTINGNVLIGGGAKNNGFENVSISGGDFKGCFYSYDSAFPRSKTVEGGTFDFTGKGYWGYLYQKGEGAESYDVTTSDDFKDMFSSLEEMEAAGWVIVPDGPYSGNGYYYDIYYPAILDKELFEEFIRAGYCLSAVGAEEDLLYEVAPCNSQEVTESKTMEQIAQEITTAGEDVPASIIEINAAATEEKAVVTVNSDIAVEGIVIKNDNNKEGQIVVESGVTLTVGNSGIVSENDELTTVVVKPGGTVIVGNGGVEQQGQATPVEIRSSATESGVFMVDPNALATVAEAPAKVKVYTRAHKDNGIEYWQQLASPVKGDRNNENKIIVKPVGELASNPNFYTSMYSWDYATDSWVRITTGEGMVDLGNDVYAFNAQWTTTDAVLKPFAAYDLINNSLESHGGITYEFAGELVGNGDMVLSFPENGFCTFGNSYTAPIDLESFFVTVKNDIQYDYDNNNNLIATSAIDPCVYIFNSAKNCFESVNQAAIKLWKKGIKTPAFTQIPPQQAFVMNLLKGNSGQSAVNYAASVWGNPNANQNVPIKAPKLAEETSTLSALLEITVTDGNATDRVMLIEDEEYSNEYDFGADAVKYMNGSFNLYANTTIGQLDMVATDNIENTELSFKAGNAVNYTISFNNVEGDFVLIDHANNSQVAIEEGGIYTFATQPNVTAENRFAIVPAAKMPTAIENTEVKANVKGIYTIMGQYLGEDFDVLPAGVYVIDGVKIVK